MVRQVCVCMSAQDLVDDIPHQEVVLGRVNSAGEDISQMSTPDDALRLRSQLKLLNTRWANICQELRERKRRWAGPNPTSQLWFDNHHVRQCATTKRRACICRSAEARTAAAEFEEDVGSMLGWLDKAEGVLAIPLHPPEPQHIRDTLSKVQVQWEKKYGDDIKND